MTEPRPKRDEDTMTDTPPVSDAEMTRVLAVKGMGWTLNTYTPAYPVWSDGQKTVCRQDDFAPLTSADDMLLLIDAMRERHKTLMWLQSYIDGTFGCDALAAPVWDLMATVKTYTPQRAVALAAYQALKGE